MRKPAAKSLTHAKGPGGDGGKSVTVIASASDDTKMRMMKAVASYQVEKPQTKVSDVATTAMIVAATGADLELDELRELLERTSPATGLPLSSDLTEPEALPVPWGGNMQRYHMASQLDRDRPQRHLKKWDNTCIIRSRIAAEAYARSHGILGRSRGRRRRRIL